MPGGVGGDRQGQPAAPIPITERRPHMLGPPKSVVMPVARNQGFQLYVVPMVKNGRIASVSGLMAIVNPA